MEYEMNKIDEEKIMMEDFQDDDGSGGAGGH